MELNSVLRQVRKLTEFAEAPINSTDPEQIASTQREQATARAQADRLMNQYQIDEAMAQAARPAEERGKPETLEVELADINSDILVYVTWLAEHVAAHTRVRLRTYVRIEEHTYLARAFGWPSDLRFFEALYTTLRLHMLGVVAPTVNPAQSLGQNAYRMHNAGYSFLDTATQYGWHVASWQDEHDSGATGLTRPWAFGHKGDAGFEVLGDMQLAGRIKRAYRAYCKAIGEPFTSSQASASRTYRLSAAEGYAARIRTRLRKLREARDATDASRGAVVLANRDAELEDFWREANASAYTRCPACQKLSASPWDCDRCGAHIADAPPTAQPCPKCKAAKSGHCRDHPRGSYRPRAFNGKAYDAGARHANTADLGTGVRNVKREIS